MAKRKLPHDVPAPTATKALPEDSQPPDITLTAEEMTTLLEVNWALEGLCWLIDEVNGKVSSDHIVSAIRPTMEKFADLIAALEHRCVGIRIGGVE